MQQIDSLSMLALSQQEVCRLDSERVSSIAAFNNFASGINIEPDFLLDSRWQTIQINNTPEAPFDVTMLEMLPAVYRAEHLDQLGGQLSIRISGVADYTVLSVNQRVIAMRGLPEDFETGEKIIDLEIAPDIFMAYARGILLDVSESVMDDDDEMEDRNISEIELQLNGIPVGAACAANSSQCGSQHTLLDGACAADAGTCGSNVGSGSASVGSVGACGINQSFNNITLGGAIACGTNLSAGNPCAADFIVCGAKTAIISPCALNASVCGAAASAVSPCTANASACGTAAGVLNACAVNSGACGVNAGVGNACAANAGVCGAQTGALGACAANANACGADVQIPCAALATACGVDAGGGIGVGVCGINVPGDPVSACLINIIPLLPSC
ncbi:hypothetical protein [Pelagibaculum spongiae]|uniref:Uncharacterized protein n=1 Tax=Pelagibaculum spongiae TaxID=2080658 RepID=A0A2V1GZS8_9GAMM|nr:hypothetical protein [Pelagibaculum spongiae]PVZ72236.1 hypothetical protein DC094_04275 [Pelagibaculum spongiae]